MKGKIEELNMPTMWCKNMEESFYKHKTRGHIVQYIKCKHGKHGKCIKYDCELYRGGDDGKS